MEDKSNNCGTWNGLHSSKFSIDEADILILAIPFDGAASFRKGAASAPDRIRSISKHIPPTSENGLIMKNLRVLDLGDIEQGTLMQKDYFQLVELKATELLGEKFCTFIGGDHSVSLPLLSAAHNIWGNDLGIIHLDAHLDLCDELDGNRLSHGSTHRRLLEKTNLPPGQVVFVGIRSFEEQELSFVGSNRMNIISAADIFANGLTAALDSIKSTVEKCRAIYLTIDIDVLDPAYAPGTGTPKPGGLTTRELLTLIKGLSSLPIIGMDLVEVSPPLDHNDITSFAAQRIITETWAHLFL